MEERVEISLEKYNTMKSRIFELERANAVLEKENRILKNNFEAKGLSEKTCDNCVSRYICFLAGAKEPCNGWNDEGMFRGLLKAIMPNSWQEIDRALDFVKNFEVETRENKYNRR